MFRPQDASAHVQQLTVVTYEQSYSAEFFQRGAYHSFRVQIQVICGLVHYDYMGLVGNAQCEHELPDLSGARLFALELAPRPVAVPVRLRNGAELLVGGDPRAHLDEAGPGAARQRY